MIKPIGKISNPALFWKRYTWLLHQYGDIDPKRYHKLMAKEGWEMKLLPENGDEEDINTEYCWFYRGKRKTHSEFKEALIEIEIQSNERI